MVFVDGEPAPLEIAPRQADGGFSLFLFQDDDGYCEAAFEIVGNSAGRGLVTEVRNGRGLVVGRRVTAN